DARQPRDVPTRTGEVGDESGADRIGNAREDDRDCTGGLPGGLRSRRTRRDDDVRLQTDQLGSKLGQSPDPPACESGLDGDVLPLDVTLFTQPLPEGAELRRGSGRAVKQKPDPPDLPRLL